MSESEIEKMAERVYQECLESGGWQNRHIMIAMASALLKAAEEWCNSNPLPRTDKINGYMRSFRLLAYLKSLFDKPAAQEEE